MRRYCAIFAAIAAVGLVSLPWVQGQDPAVDPDETLPTGVRFAYADMYVDADDQPLAAYQVELKIGEGDARIVGIEGGDHPAFRDPPYYDPKALMQARVILAALSTGEDLPTGRTRVARVHLRVAGDSEPVYAAELHTAASATGAEIAARVSVQKGVALP